MNDIDGMGEKIETSRGLKIFLAFAAIALLAAGITVCVMRYDSGEQPVTVK